MASVSPCYFSSVLMQMKYRLPPFTGLTLRFYGFDQDEQNQMEHVCTLSGMPFLVSSQQKSGTILAWVCSRRGISPADMMLMQ